MEAILYEIRSALAFGFHYFAVTASLMLPDMCAALEQADGESSQTHYRAWYDQWLSAKYPGLSSSDIYRLRCGAVHQGIFSTRQGQIRVVFMIDRFPVMHNIQAEHGGVVVLHLNAHEFCQDVMNSVEDWYAARQSDANVQRNLPRLMQYHATGIPGLIVGLPLIG
jgi:hypothetical protein